MDEKLQQASTSTQYREILILHLDHLSIVYRDLLKAYARGAANEELYNDCICEMVVVLDFIYPKLKGGGAKTKALLNTLDNEYIDWTNNIMIPKLHLEERKKVHGLYKLIQEAYDVLGLSSY